MPKGSTGGGKHKHRARKNNLADAHAKQLTLADPENGERYAVVKKVQSGHADVLCEDGTPLICRIGGSFRKKKRGNTLVAGGGILIGMRGFSEREKHCDLAYVYDADEIARIPQLQRLCNLHVDPNGCASEDEEVAAAVDQAMTVCNEEEALVFDDI